MRESRFAITLVFLLSALLAPVLPASGGLDEAARAVAAGELERAIAELGELYDSGYPTPADVLADPRFSALREDGPSRAALRELLGAHVRESRIVMVAPDEAGEPMLVRGRVLEAPGGEPIAGAVLEIYHTDNTGNYAPGQPVGQGANSRLFSFVRTDPQGRFEIRTIKPAPYPGSGPGAAHVHYRIAAEGYRAYGADFRPYDHPRDPEERARSLEKGWRSSTVSSENGLLICEVMIPMRPLGRD